MGACSREEALKRKPRPYAYANIVSWYKANLINLGFIAVSKSCRRVLASLEEHERDLFPESTELLRAKIRLMHSGHILSELRTIMGNDLVKEGI
jgi:hypothetical protein